MNFRTVFFLTAINIACFSVQPFAAARNIDNNRMDAVNNALDCVSNNPQQDELGWNDICYSSPEQKEQAQRQRAVGRSLDEVAREHQAFADAMLSKNDGSTSSRTIDDVYKEQDDHRRATSKSMDQTIQEHSEFPNEMLGPKDDEETPSSPRTVDDVYTEQNEHHKNSRSVDDMIKEERIYETTPPPQETPSLYNTSNDNLNSTQNSGQDEYTQLAGRFEEETPPSKPLPEMDLLDDSTSSKWNDLDANTPSMNNNRSLEHRFEFTPEVYYYHYEEPDVMEYSGIWKGFTGKYVYRPLEGNRLNNEVLNVYGLEASYAYSNDDTYDGGGIGSGGPVSFKSEGIDASMWETRLILGKDYDLPDQSRLTPYVGFGVRQKTDESGGTVTIIGPDAFLGYDRTATYYYVPIGVSVEIPSKSDTEIGLNLEYDFLIKGYTKSHNSDMDQFTMPAFGSEDLTFEQKRGFGIRASMKFLKRYPLLDLYVEPFLRYWNFQDSEPETGSVLNSVDTYIEPKNNTFEAGSKVGVRF